MTDAAAPSDTPTPAPPAKPSEDEVAIFHSLSAGPVPLLWGLYARHGLRPRGWRYAWRWWKLLASSFAGIPFRAREFVSAKRRQALHTPIQAPVFVIGHWRSGTTFLHNLLTKDPQFGFLTLEHCILTYGFLTFPNWMRRLMTGMVPEDRVVDKVPLGWDVPQEEEFATERMTPLCYNHCYLFPDKAEEIFRRGVLFESSETDRLRWEGIYDRLLRKLSLQQGGKRLCLKNPPNTARIPSLLRMYPDAKFVYIVRHPEHVFRSTRQLWKTVTQLLGLTRATAEERDRNFVLFYELTQKKYLADRAAIPAGNLVEVKFEELSRDPMRVLTSIYQELQLDGFEAARPHFEEHVTETREFQKNPHRLDPADQTLVRDRWGFAFDAWKYE